MTTKEKTVRTTVKLAIGIFAAAIAASVHAQQTNTTPGYRMPYQSGFWGYVGGAVGASKFGSCAGSGVLFSCDRRDTAWKVYGGGNFNQTFGLEIGYLDL